MFITIDIALVISSIVISSLVYNHRFNVTPLSILVILIVVLSYSICAYIYDINNVTKHNTLTNIINNIILANVVSDIITVIAFFSIPFWHRKVYILNCVLILLFSVLWRLLSIRLYNIIPNVTNLLIVASGPLKDELIEILTHRYYFNVIGDVNVELLDKDSDRFMLIFNEAIKGKNIKIMIVSSKTYNVPQILKIVYKLMSIGVQVYDFNDVYEHLTGKAIISTDFTLVSSEYTFGRMRNDIYKYKVKPLIDKSLSGLFLLTLSPLVLIIAVAIIVDSFWPILFVQKRIGLNEKIFSIFKFRSMRVNAGATPPSWTDIDDDRITYIGKIIRRYRIDEIPQLWNVLKGEMSLIGPRPEVPEFVKVFEKANSYYSLRHCVKPGITGWSQIKYKYAASKEESMTKLQYDLYYIKNMSFTLDLYIIIETLKVVIIGRGAR
ncbi:MAG: exopolysaccharide biosynthesis polyprenyl glycosylphosphotransferase [Nitrospirae bacterium]|nr:exopolysaccharide biosynthesis polyprenyl glycosylphosphotransferase [Nitrospirota bacterium]